MQSYKSESIRNVALLSHSKAGKTSLSEAILFNAGHTTRLGRVEDGNTTSDYEPEEVNRGGSIQLTLLPYEWNDTKVNLIDTPGYADFFGEVVAALKVADSALLVVCAASGIEVGTELMWGEISARELPAMILLNKMDRENADFAAVLKRIQDEFGRQCVAIQLPIGAESDFKGVLDLITMKAKGPDDQDIEIPADLADQAGVLRDAMAEAVAEGDDDLTMKYLEGEELTEEELVKGLAEGVRSGAIVPVMAAAAQSNTCVKAIMDNISAYMPSPIDRGGVTAKDLVSEESVTLNGDGNSPMAAFVFKTSADPFVGKLSYFRVYSDTMHSDSQVWNSGKNSGEKISQLFMARGKSQENVTEVVTGDIGSVAKLSATSSGDTLCNRDRPLGPRRNRIPFLSPVRRCDGEVQVGHRQAGLLTRPPGGRRPDSKARNRSRHRTDAAVGDGRGPYRHDAAEAGPEVLGGGGHRDTPDSVQGNHHHAHQVRVQAQEADWWARAVRTREDTVGAHAAGIRDRVCAEGSRGQRAEELHTGS